jgi:hypothetical protein
VQLYNYGHNYTHNYTLTDFETTGDNLQPDLRLVQGVLVDVLRWHPMPHDCGESRVRCVGHGLHLVLKKWGSTT